MLAALTLAIASTVATVPPTPPPIGQVVHSEHASGPNIVTYPPGESVSVYGHCLGADKVLVGYRNGKGDTADQTRRAVEIRDANGNRLAFQRGAHFELTVPISAGPVDARYDWIERPTFIPGRTYRLDLTPCRPAPSTTLPSPTTVLPTPTTVISPTTVLPPTTTAPPTTVAPATTVPSTTTTTPTPTTPTTTTTAAAAVGLVPEPTTTTIIIHRQLAPPTTMIRDTTDTGTTTTGTELAAPERGRGGPLAWTGFDAAAALVIAVSLATLGAAALAAEAYTRILARRGRVS